MQCTGDSPPHSSTWDEESGCTSVQQASPKYDPHFEENEISFKITPLLLLFPLLKKVYQERALENNNKKRVVFYIQINLYFCHKTLRANRRFSTQSFVKDPQKHTVTITHRFTGQWPILQSCNYFLWTFFSPLSLTRSISRNDFAQEHRKTSL